MLGQALDDRGSATCYRCPDLNLRTPSGYKSWSPSDSLGTKLGSSAIIVSSRWLPMPIFTCTLSRHAVIVRALGRAFITICSDDASVRMERR